MTDRNTKLRLSAMAMAVEDGKSNPGSDLVHVAGEIYKFLSGMVEIPTSLPRGFLAAESEPSASAIARRAYQDGYKDAKDGAPNAVNAMGKAECKAFGGRQ